jgi:Rieske Fe-S protein
MRGVVSLNEPQASPDFCEHCSHAGRQLIKKGAVLTIDCPAHGGR